MARFFSFFFLLLLPLIVIGCQPAEPPTAPKERMAQEEQERIEKTVAAYIKKHPEEILAAVSQYQRDQKLARQKEELLRSLNHRVSVTQGNSPRIGAKKAAITIYEFSDFQCPYCARVGVTTDALMKKYDGQIAFVYKYFPLDFHKKSRSAAKAAMAAGEQGQFWPFKKRLMASQREWGAGDEKALFVTYAKDLNLDIDRFKRDVQKKEYDTIIEADIAEGKRVGVRSTPSFIINGALVTGAQPLSSFEAVIEALQAKEKQG